MRLASGVTDQYLYFVAVDATDFTTRETGLATWTVYRSRNGGAAAAMTTPTINETDATNMPGVYELLLDEDTTIDSGDVEQEMVFHITHTGMAPVTRSVTLFRPQVTAGETLTVTSGLASANTTQIGGTAQTARDLGASVLLSSGTGTGQISLSSGEVTPTSASKTGYRLSATGVDDIWDENIVAAHQTSESAGAVVGGQIAISGTVQTGGNYSTTLELPAAAVADDDYYNDMVCEVIGGTGIGQSLFISDYVGSTQIATMNGTFATTLDATSVVQVRKFGSLPGASAPTANQNAAAVWNALSSDYVAEGSMGAVMFSPHTGTAQAATSTSITLDATGSSSTNGFYNYSYVKIVSGTGAGQMRQISPTTTYNGTTKVATVTLAWATTPDATSVYVIIPGGLDAATVSQLADAVWDEARAGHVASGSFGEYVLADSIRVSGSATAADLLEAATAGTTPLPANVTQISSDATAADNLEAYTDGTTPMPVNATQISGDATAADNLEAALDGTGGVTISANVDGYVEVRSTGGSAGHNAADLVTSMLTTQMTEAYNTDGTAPTLAQALFVMMQRLTESEISGTTLTVKQLDGSTGAYTITLDDGTNPTSMTRAT